MSHDARRQASASVVSRRVVELKRSALSAPVQRQARVGDQFVRGERIKPAA